MTTLKQKIIIVLIIILVIQLLITLYLLYDWWSSKNEAKHNIIVSNGINKEGFISSNNSITISDATGAKKLKYDSSTKIIRFETGVVIENIYIINDSTIKNNSNKRVGLYFINNNTQMYIKINIDNDTITATSTPPTSANVEYAWYFEKQSDNKYYIYSDFINLPNHPGVGQYVGYMPTFTGVGTDLLAIDPADGLNTDTRFTNWLWTVTGDVDIISGTLTPAPTIISISHPTLGRLQVQNNGTNLVCSTSGPPVYFLVHNGPSVFNSFNHRVTLQACDSNGNTSDANLGKYLIRNDANDNVSLGDKVDNSPTCAWYFCKQNDGTYYIYNDVKYTPALFKDGKVATKGKYLSFGTSLITTNIGLNRQKWNITLNFEGVLPDFPPVSSAIQIKYSGSNLYYNKNDPDNTTNAYNITTLPEKGIEITNYYINNDPTISNYKYKRCAIYFIDDQYNARYILHHATILKSFCWIEQSPAAVIDLINNSFIGVWYFALQSSGKYLLYNDYNTITTDTHYGYLYFDNITKGFKWANTDKYGLASSPAIFDIAGSISSIPQYDTSKGLDYTTSCYNDMVRNNTISINRPGYSSTSGSREDRSNKCNTKLGIDNVTPNNNLITFIGGIQIPYLYIKHTNDFNDKRVGIYYITEQYKIRYLKYEPTNAFIYNDEYFVPTNPNYLWSFKEKVEQNKTYYVIYNDVITMDGSRAIGNYIGPENNFDAPNLNLMYIRRYVNLTDPSIIKFDISNPINLSPPVTIPTIKTSTPDYVSNVKYIKISNDRKLTLFGIFVYGIDGSQIDITKIGTDTSNTGIVSQSSTNSNMIAKNAFKIINYVADDDPFIPLNKYRSLTDAVSPQNIFNSSASNTKLLPGSLSGLKYPDNNTLYNQYTSETSDTISSWTYTFNTLQNISGIEIFTIIGNSITIDLLDSSSDTNNNIIAQGRFGQVLSNDNTHKVFTIGSYPDISPTLNPDSPIINVMDISEEKLGYLTRIPTITQYVPTTTQYMPTTPTSTYTPTTPSSTPSSTYISTTPSSTYISTTPYTTLNSNINSDIIAKIKANNNAVGSTIDSILAYL